MRASCAAELAAERAGMRGRMGAGDVGAAGVGARTLTRPCGRGLAQDWGKRGLWVRLVGRADADASVRAGLGAEAGQTGADDGAGCGDRCRDGSGAGQGWPRDQWSAHPKALLIARQCSRAAVCCAAARRGRGRVDEAAP